VAVGIGHFSCSDIQIIIGLPKKIKNKGANTRMANRCAKNIKLF
jgi:hypothetical protein